MYADWKSRRIIRYIRKKNEENQGMWIISICTIDLEVFAVHHKYLYGAIRMFEEEFKEIS